MMTQTPMKRARREITPLMKKEICLYKNAHPKATRNDILRHFSSVWGITIGRSTVYDILKQKDKWLLVSDVATPLTRMRSCKEPELEAALLTWFNDARSRYTRVTTEMIVDKAKMFGEQLGVENFSYSNGWVDRFKKRYGISRHTIYGEPASAIASNANEIGQDMGDVLAMYNLKDTFNTDETVVHFPDNAESDKESICEISQVVGDSSMDKSPRTDQEEGVCYRTQDVFPEARLLNNTETQIENITFPQAMEDSSWYKSNTLNGEIVNERGDGALTSDEDSLVKVKQETTEASNSCSLTSDIDYFNRVSTTSGGNSDSIEGYGSTQTLPGGHEATNPVTLNPNHKPLVKVEPPSDGYDSIQHVKVKTEVLDTDNENDSLSKAADKLQTPGNKSTKILKTLIEKQNNTDVSVDEPRRLRKNRNPVARYGFDSSDEISDIINLDDSGDERERSKIKDIKHTKSTKNTPTETGISQPRTTPTVVEHASPSCLVCKKVAKCKFNIMRNGEVKHLCDDKCFQKFRSYPAQYLGAKVSISPASKPAPPTPVIKKVQPVLTCSVCQIMNINAQKPFISWHGMDLCGESCLSSFKENLGTCCANCDTFIAQSLRGMTVLKLRYELKQFCTTNCLNDFKNRMKVCSTCEKDLTGNSDAFVAPIGKQNEFKDFCSPECLEKYVEPSATKTVTVTNVEQRAIQPCAVCSKLKRPRHSVDLDKKTHYLCNSICLSIFQQTHKLSVACDNCGVAYYSAANPPQCIQFEGFQKRFCSTNCVNLFRNKNKKLKPCTWCRTKKINFDMIERVDSNNQYQLFCSLNCLSLYRVNLQATSNQVVTCDHCKKVCPAQYHLTMSDASVRNFCSYSCVLAFQSAYNTSSATTTSNSKIGLNSSKPTIATPARSVSMAEPATPIISSVISLAAAGKNQSLKTQTPKIQTPKTQAQKTQIPKGPLIPATKPQPNSTLPTTKPAPPTITKQIIVQPAAPKSCANKSVMSRPFVHTKGTTCTPCVSHASVQTDTENLSTRIIPVPVPIYVPIPMAMYTAPTPVALPIPIPIPVPCFIPTTKKSATGIAKFIKEITEKVPSDPLEAELVAMAEAVGADTKADQLSDDEDPNNYEESNDNIADKQIEVADSTPMNEDMLQLALRMATELSNSTTDVEVHVDERALEPESQDTDVDVSFEPVQNAPKRSAPVRSSRKRKRPRLSPSPEPETEPAPQPTEAIPQSAEPAQQTSLDANYHLKFMYGVNAWMHWVAGRNQDLAATQKQLGKKVSVFKTDVLQCSVDEINYSLCLFVKEVCKPNGTKYAADSIYYLCLGIQQYLIENGRVDNIFMDSYYERFTDCLNDIISGYTPTINPAGQLVCRIEEEHLWECKQLGAHSPQVLLNTLIYFNTKYFMLFTEEDHMSLSFSHIMKHWKKSNTAEGTPGRCVYLRYQLPAKTSKGESSRKKPLPVYYEQSENIDNPLRCPVKLYEFYLSKCPDSTKTRTDVFYLVPERSCVPDSPVWYSTSQLQVEALRKMLNRARLIKEIQEVQLSV